MSCKSQVALIYNFCIDVGHTRQAFILYPVYIFLFFSPERGKKELYGLYIYFLQRYCVLICKSADSLPRPISHMYDYSRFSRFKSHESHFKMKEDDIIPASFFFALFFLFSQLLGIHLYSIPIARPMLDPPVHALGWCSLWGRIAATTWTLE